MAKTTYSREELERRLSESRREFLAADATINNLELKLADMAEQIANAESKCAELAAEKETFAVECAAAKIVIAYLKSGRQGFSLNTPATDAFLAEVRAQGVDMAMEHMQSSGSLTFGDCYISLNEFAAQLRHGAVQ